MSGGNGQSRSADRAAEELAAENQPPLYGDDGEPVDTEGEPVDNVVRPEFSDGGK